jgi:endoglucanase
MGRDRRGDGTVRRRLLVGLVAVGLLLPLVAAAPQPVAASAPAAAVVRVDQLGYRLEGTKRAYLMAPRSESGATFAVVDASGHVVFRGRVADDEGRWSASYPHVYALTFDALARRGVYKVVVHGPDTASSPAFRVDSARALYARAMANSLSFFENERDGANFIPSALRREPAHLNDASAMTYRIPTLDSNDGLVGDLTPLGKRIDASGAWWDAGDYLKFVETDSYVVAMMETGIRDFPGQLGPGSSTANFTAEAAVGLDFLTRMWDDATRTLYLEVGIGSGNSTIVGDHDIWRLPQADDAYGGSDPSTRYIRHRPVFRAGPPGSLISPNLAGRLAADFALCYQLERTTEPAQARRCLINAEHIFDLANTHPGRLQTAIAYDFYPETEWRDDLEWGATELYKALAAGPVPAGVPHRDPGAYLRQAARWAHAYITGPSDAVDTLNLYDDSAVAHYDLARALAAAPTAGLAVTRTQLIADLDKQLDGAKATAAADPFGFGFPWGAFDTTSHGAGLVVTAAEYDALTGRHTYAAFATRQLDDILGANAWGTSLIVGDGTTFPDCMQHQVTNLVGSRNGSPPVLAGAVVEGPNSFSATGLVSGMRPCPPQGGDRFAAFNSATAVYQDNVQSWSTVEPALDLTASSPLAFAWQVRS